MGSWNTFMSSALIRSSKFETYETALAHWTSVKPIRGRSVELRPMGSNRGYTQCEVKNDPLSQTISAWLYNTECVSIDITGHIRISTGGWVSPSTMSFINAVLPSKYGSVYQKSGKAIYRTAGSVSSGGSIKEYVIPNDKVGIMLQVDSDWSGANLLDNQTATTEKHYEYKANRKVMNTFRKQYAGFLSMLDVMSAMSSSYETGEIVEHFPEIVPEYLERKAKHEAEDKIREAKCKQTGQTFYKYSFNEAWSFRDVIQNATGLPSISEVSSQNDNASLYLHSKEVGTEVQKWVGQRLDNLRERIMPLLMEVLNDALSTDIQTQRRTMIRIATNPSNYAEGGYGIDSPKLRVNNIDVPVLKYHVNKSQMEKYLIDTIKFVYADKIFEYVEVPNGSIPSVVNQKYVQINKFLRMSSDILTSRKVVL